MTNKTAIKKSLIVSLIYMLFGSLWIFYSDIWVYKIWASDPEMLSNVQTEKGILYVILSTFLIGGLSYLVNNHKSKADQNKKEYLYTLKERLKDNRMLLDSTSDLIWYFDSDLRLLSFNKSFYLYLKHNFDFKASKGDHLNLEGISDREKTKWRRYFIKALRGESFQKLISLELTSGDKIYLDCAFYPLVKNNKVERVSVFATNITAWVTASNKKNEALKELKSQADFITNTLDNLPVGIAIEDSVNYKFSFTNKEFNKIFELNSNSDFKSFEALSEQVNIPQYLSERRFSKGSFEHNKLGKPTEYKEVNIFFQNEHKKVLDIKSIPIENHGVIVNTIVDNTESYQKANDLINSKAYLNILSTQASDAIISCDEDGQIIFYNEKFLEWFKPQEILPIKDWADSYNLYQLHQNRKLNPNEICLNIALQQGRLTNYRYRIVIDGEERFIEANGAALRDQYSKPKGAMVVLRDISERTMNEIQQTNSILEAIDKERSEIARNLHDGLIQHLAIVHLNLKSIDPISQLDLQDKEILNSSVDHLKSLIKECRELSHNLIPESIINYGLKGALFSFAHRFNLNGTYKISLNISEELKLETKKELQIFRVIQQACMNAISHADCDKIFIDIYYRNDRLFIEIADNGKGFDLEEVSSNGIGILSMRNRVQSMNGKFDLFSNKGEGTRIIIELGME